MRADIPSSPHPDGRMRCPWPGTDPLYVAYHDEEWGVPEFDSRALFEKLILDGFQAGLSWITILRKRDAFRAAFANFDPEKIAYFNAKKIAALMNNPGIIRNRTKIEGAVVFRTGLPGDRGAGRLFRFPVEVLRWTAAAERLSHEGSDPDAVCKIGGVVERAQGPRLQILRPDDRLCLLPGGGNGE